VFTPVHARTRGLRSPRLGDLLKDIYVPETIAQTIVDSLQSDSARAEAERQTQMAATQRRITALHGRMDQMYEDKLDGKIDDEFWTRKTNECREQERRLESEMSSLRAQVGAENVLTVKKIFELANRAHFLYFTRNQAERGQLLKSVLLNCDTDGVSLLPVYRKPFDLIFERAKNQDWSGREDLNLRPPGPEPGALPG
jgi:site-specific DNA recombinase